MTTLGTSNGRVPLRTGGVGVGERVLVTKGIAIEGTAILAQAWARNESAPDVSPPSNGFSTFHWNDSVGRNHYRSVST